MTLKERIEAFVKQQGNQVGAGAELAAILNDIVDSIPGAYTLPPATAETLGGVKVGSGLAVTEEGVLSVSGGASVMIVEGTVGNDEFQAEAGQPTVAAAIQAFLAGITVILKYLDEYEVDQYVQVSRYSDSALYTASNISWE